MITISDKVKCMASLATFRKMKLEGLTLYDVLGQLAGQIIIEQNIRNSDNASLKQIMKREAGIDVPISMVSSSLKRLDFVDSDKVGFQINEKLTVERRQEVLNQLKEARLRDERVYSTLINFVEKKLQTSLSEEERELLKRDFCSYMVKDAYNVKYADQISNFLLAMENDSDFMEQISHIREGLIIFLGLAYNVNDEQIDALDNPLCLYLETEVLFNMAGYNGELFKCLFDEFYGQIEEINKRAHKPLVQLLYFEETKTEFEGYFSKAEDIVKGKCRLDNSKTAMRTIVKSCKESYDVAQLLSEFKILLKQKKIVLDSQRNYYDREHSQLNIIQQQTFDELVRSNVGEEDKVYEKLSLLNYIYSKRGNRSHQYFRNVGHILVSANSRTFSTAKCLDLQQGTVPLVWGMDALTNRFWQMLNKGIIPSNQMKSVDILSKARIVISNNVNNTIERLFKEIDVDLENGKLTEEKAKAGIVELRKYSVAPEDITAENADTYVTFNEQSIEQLIAENEAQMRKAQKTIEEHEKTIKERERSLEGMNDMNRAAIKRLTAQANAEIKKQYDEAVEEYESEQSENVAEEFKKYKLRQVEIGGLYLFVAFSLFVLNYTYGGEKKWYIGVVIAGIIFLIPFILALINFQPIKKAYRFLFYKKERESVRYRFKKEYEHQHKRPILLLKKESDIAKELKNSSK